jgi:transcription elongation factor Elf1
MAGTSVPKGKKIKACPFCGSVDVSIERLKLDVPNRFHARCGGCGAASG